MHWSLPMLKYLRSIVSRVQRAPLRLLLHLTGVDRDGFRTKAGSRRSWSGMPLEACLVTGLHFVASSSRVYYKTHHHVQPQMFAHSYLNLIPGLASKRSQIFQQLHPRGKHSFNVIRAPPSAVLCLHLQGAPHPWTIYTQQQPTSEPPSRLNPL
jgi:hypothetical protein